MSLIKTIVIMLILVGVSFSSSSLIIRPQGGYGYFHSADPDSSGATYHAGARILLPASEVKRYGLEFSWFDVKNGGEFTSMGILIEQKMWNWFNSSIGTVGYFGFGEDSENIVGLMTNLGWEPNWDKPLKPFITYRTDFIFSEELTTIHSLSAGLALGF